MRNRTKLSYGNVRSVGKDALNKIGANVRFVFGDKHQKFTRIKFCTSKVLSEKELNAFADLMYETAPDMFDIEVYNFKSKFQGPYSAYNGVCVKLHFRGFVQYKNRRFR
jgi:hypothetical protein